MQSTFEQSLATPSPHIVLPMQPAPTTRLLSLDVFRGLIVAAMILVTDPGTYGARYRPLCHSDWAGPTATDIISPAFLLMVGMAIPFAFASRLKRGVTRGRLLLHILGRTILLFLIGLLLNTFPDFDLHTIRIPGILQHIALCYAAASLLYMAVSAGGVREETDRVLRRSLIFGIAALSVLAVYWGLLKSYPVPGFGAGRTDSLGSLPAYVDRAVFGVRHLWTYGTTPGYGVTFDPDGLLSTLAVLAITLIGVLAGEWLRTPQSQWRKVGVLAAAGVGLVLAGYGLSPWMPLVKKIWTPTFVLWSTGVALLIFAVLYLVLDLRRWRGLAGPALVVGTNAIFAFALSTVVTSLLDRIHILIAPGSAMTIHKWVYVFGFATWLKPIYASLAYAIAIVLLNLALVYPLYRKRIFLRI